MNSLPFIIFGLLLVLVIIGFIYLMIYWIKRPTPKLKQDKGNEWEELERLNQKAIAQGDGSWLWQTL